MLMTPARFRVPMLDGKSKERSGYTFTIPTLAGRHRLAIHKCGDNSCIISDYRTGLKVLHEWTASQREAAQGVADMVKVGALDPHKIIDGARGFPTLNRDVDTSTP